LLPAFVEGTLHGIPLHNSARWCETHRQAMLTGLLWPGSRRRRVSLIKCVHGTAAPFNASKLAGVVHTWPF